MSSPQSLAESLADALVRGEWTVTAMRRRVDALIGRRRFTLGMIERLLAHPFQTPRPRSAVVAAFLMGDSGLSRAWDRTSIEVKTWLLAPPAMRPVDAAVAWSPRALVTLGALAEWLTLSIAELDWFVDRRGLNPRHPSEAVRHYRCRPVSKRFGHVRLIEAPKPRLKAIQRRILTEILDRVPPHPTAQGFRKGSSICTFAAPHVSQRVVVRMDLRDFFPSIQLGKVQALFRTIGYPEAVADALAGLCTTATPNDAWANVAWPDRQTEHATRERYARRHLPQGAPSSPALANLCAYRLDCRLAGLAEECGARYTRYADDLAFSWDEDFNGHAQRFPIHVAAIAMEEGFSVHHRKTRVMARGVRQRLAGLVVNERLNVPRHEYDRLKATLTNCVRSGPTGQNRDEVPDFRRHLEGRVAFVRMVNAARGEKLAAILRRIEW